MTKYRTLHPATAAGRIAFLLLALAGLAIAIGSQWLWRHRQEIGAALIAAVATTYSAEARCRQQVEALAADSARRLHSQPVAAVAPITATLAAAWGLVDRGTMTREDRVQRTQLTNNEPTPIKVDNLVSAITKAINASNAYLKQRPNIITLSTLRATHFALVEAADHIRRTEGHSNAYCRASNASDAVRDILIKRSNA